MSTTSLPFDNTYARLPERFHARVAPTPVREPRLIHLNTQLAGELGLDAEWLASPDGVAMLAGNAMPPNAASIATAYAGHQFGGFVPQLGDGRAILIGEVVDVYGTRRDIQLKGPGRTPFSRGGDGRAAVGPVIREYIVSEAMHAMGIRTTRSLAAVATGEQIFRERMLPGAVLTRVASSHIRVGTFEYFAARNDIEALKLLTAHVLKRHYPHAAGASNPAIALLDDVVDAQASLIASWLCVGFIHGVMNTDNMSIAGETIDYGPCAFMDEYDPQTVFSSIDRYGRYAYNQQPAIGEWNLARLAESMLPIVDADADAAVRAAEEVLQKYATSFERAYHAGLRRKLGLSRALDGDIELAGGLLEIMMTSRADFTSSFRALCDAATDPDATALRAAIGDAGALGEWLVKWRERLAREGQASEAIRGAMRAANPAYVPRNHRVEAVIRAAEDNADYGPFVELLDVVTTPFDDQPGREEYRRLPAEGERVMKTFCGT